jgi:predicted RNA-binding protein with PIN domain
VQIFYSPRGQTADAIVERLASKYVPKFHVSVATFDSRERETVIACGAETILAGMLRNLIAEIASDRGARV